MSSLTLSIFIFFFNDTATTEIYTLSLHDALPILLHLPLRPMEYARTGPDKLPQIVLSTTQDRKSTRLNSSHGYISYAVFCLKKKKKYVRVMVALESQQDVQHVGVVQTVRVDIALS